VLVHDAARPCLSSSRLEKFLEQGLKSPEGAILAVPVGDTLKRAGDAQEIIATVDRNGLWAAQTPQLFRVGALAEAIDAAHKQGCELTDEASAMEFVGVRPLLVMGSAANIKITHSSDLAIAEALLMRKDLSS
jgi:2-C-methyl-D-erythritol 4-phosphate cytidylyltransferase